MTLLNATFSCDFDPKFTGGGESSRFKPVNYIFRTTLVQIAE